MSKSRKPIPKAVETSVLVACRRRCCLCWYLNGDTAEKAGQIAHVDRDSSNNLEDNLAWLCLPHHEQYDRTSRQAKGLTEAELRHAREELWKYLRQPSTPVGPSSHAAIAPVFNQPNQHVGQQINIAGYAHLTVNSPSSLPPASLKVDAMHEEIAGGSFRVETGTKDETNEMSESQRLSFPH